MGLTASRRINNGLLQVALEKWSQFDDFLQEIEDMTFIWRGQRKAEWKLQASLDRSFSETQSDDYNAYKKAHLETFKEAILGRRGINPPVLTENGLWALGQHYGLKTPLLDWTKSPYVAAFFAFEEPTPQHEHPEYDRAIYALNTNLVTWVTERFDQIRQGLREDREELELIFGTGNKLDKCIGRLQQNDCIEAIRPQTDENSRLLNQAGLFTISPHGSDLITWVQKLVQPEDISLIKITLANNQREAVLKSLNRMNINHATLFPDLYGASKYANMCMEIPDYGLALPKMKPME